MFILHVLYFFRTIPLPILAHLKTLQKIMNSFIWNSKRAKVCKASLYTLASRAELGAPDLSKYHTSHYLRPSKHCRTH